VKGLAAAGCTAFGDRALAAWSRWPGRADRWSQLRGLPGGRCGAGAVGLLDAGAPEDVPSRMASTSSCGLRAEAAEALARRREQEGAQRDGPASPTSWPVSSRPRRGPGASSPPSSTTPWRSPWRCRCPRPRPGGA
jgi:hypothetical protein